MAMTAANNKQGSMVCVGLGMTLGAHIAPLSRSHIQEADVVFCGASDPLVELWVKEMHPDVRSLQPFYREGKDRRHSYQQMVAAMMAEVRAGKKVVGAFYGHPGVFAWAPHKVIETARAEGFAAHMEPGISAEDCLFADLGLDPGKTGCQQFEASQFMFYRRQLDTAALLVLWQVAMAGDRSTARYQTGNPYRQVLLELLLDHYPPDHQVVLYEAPTLPIHPPRLDWFPLQELAKVQVHQHSTLVIPPATALVKNQDVLDRLAALDKDHD